MPVRYKSHFLDYINKRVIYPALIKKREIKQKQLSVAGISRSERQYYSIPVNFSNLSAIADHDFFEEQNPKHLTVVHLISYLRLSFSVRLLKRLFDICFSSIVMVLGLPVFIILYLITKFSSPGPAFYKQQRIGRYERPFYIYKFRSMHQDAEKFGPQLSSTTDPRITKWGRIIRMSRLDELPQFWNVIKGEMSVVGPRPERQHFISQITEKNLNYKKLQGLKPGITSMGQVYFGYAENVDQMCERMIYDLHYIQKVNIYTDLRIILKTLQVMFQFKGK